MTGEQATRLAAILADTAAKTAQTIDVFVGELKYPNGGVIRGPWRCMASDRWSMIDADGRQYCEYWHCVKDEGHDGPHRFEQP